MDGLAQDRVIRGDERLLLAGLHLAWAVPQLLWLAVYGGWLFCGGLLLFAFRDVPESTLYGWISVAIGLFGGALSLAWIAAIAAFAVGFYRCRPWATPLGYGVAALTLLSGWAFPVAQVLGGYTLWVLVANRPR